jgi:ABC-type branched-subunit amino acid transport system substrate-binding protein
VVERRTRRCLILIVGLVVAVGSSMVAVNGAAASAPRQVQGIDGNKIKVGGLIEEVSFSGAEDGFKARINRANEDHELGKYTIDYVGSTDPGQGNTDKALSATQSLVERDQVFALAPILTVSFQQSVGTYATSKKVPYFGGGFTKAFCAPNTYGFSFIGCAIGAKYASTMQVESVATAMDVPAKGLKWAIVALAQPDGEQIVKDYSKQVKATGGKVVYGKAVIPPGGGGDLQPFVSAVMDTKPDVVWILASSEVLGFTSAMKAGGYNGQLLNSAFYLPGLLPKVSTMADALEGSLVVTNTPVLEADSPYVKKMVADYEAIGKSQGDISFGGEFGYETADSMIAMMKKVAPNFEKLVPTISKGFKYQPVKDGTPLSWPAAYDAGGNCDTTVRVASGGVYEVAAPWKCGGKTVKLK